MNVIATNCAGSYVMTRNNSPLGNPFVWAFIPYKSIREMLTRFPLIKYTNVKLLPSFKWKGTYTLRIDDCVDIHYIHYHQNPAEKTLKVHNHDVSYYKIQDYILERYMVRLKRMQHLKEEPRFLILQNNSAGTTEEFIDLYTHTPVTKYRICWGVFDNLKIPLKPNTIRIGSSELPIAIVNRCYPTIYTYLYG